jgi:hypothetical protein
MKERMTVQLEPTNFHPSSLPLMERVWLIVATLCLIAAAIFLWRSLAEEVYVEAAFVAASLGIVAWFLRLRIQLKRALPKTASAPVSDEEDVENLVEN